MRRPIAIASALVVLVGGVAAGCGGDDGDTGATTAVTATAGGTSTMPVDGVGAGTASTAVQQLKRDLAAVVADMRKRPFAHDEARLASLEQRLAAISAGITTLEADAGAPGAPSAAAMASLREAESHLRQYIAEGRAGDDIAMQLQVYRYLWTLNQLPDSLSTLYGA